MKQKINKSLLFLLFIFLLSFNVFSQISFEKGYFITNTEQRIECLIKNLDWRSNPTNFEYKLSDNDEIINNNIKSVKEFGIYNNLKYISYNVKIDKSNENINNLNYERNPVYNEELLFLKVLVEGKSNLYFYENGNLQKFFYNIDNSTIKQLFYKKYLTTDNNIGKNSLFKQQLNNDLKCQTIDLNKIENLEYKKNSLINFFNEYNTCSNSDVKNYDRKVKKDLFNLTIRAHVNNSSLSIEKSISERNVDFGNGLGIGLGIEAEFILPYNKNKWAVVIEPIYRSFNSEKTSDVSFVSGGKLKSIINYSSIEVPLSVRHYLFLKNGSKIFINASYIFDFSTNSSIEFNRLDNSSYDSLKINARNNLAFGLGYKFKERYSIEMRVQSNRNILGDYAYWKANYNTSSIIFGYSLF